jgi:2-oxoglutarate dehydrogenase E2 component (dihydrolipoamide succinyltransferase)
MGGAGKQTVAVRAPIEQEGSKAIVKAWYKKIGDIVALHEPIVELETDKVAVEVPAPTAGVLVEIVLAPEDDAAPGAILGRIAPSSSESAALIETAIEQARAPAVDPDRELRMSPAVRLLVTESGIDPRTLAGTGRGGRLTRQDVVEAIERRSIPAVPPAVAAPAVESPTPSTTGGDQRVLHDSMRRRIAAHMSHSLSTAPHVTAVFEADFSAIAAHRQAHKADFERRGAKLTITAYIVQACVEAMQAVPIVNSLWRDDFLEVFADANIGVATALGEKGLIVPVVHHANSLSLFEVASRLTEMTELARTGKLGTADVRGGTFTISNHGVSGSLMAAPIIINQPQVAILGVGKLEKRAVVRDVGGADAIVIRPMAYVSLTIDHRALDGAHTNAWLSRFVEVVEGWSA